MPGVANLLERLRCRCARPADGASLALFRILFGAIMVYEIAFWFWPLAGTAFSPDFFHFTYQGLGFVKPWPGAWMHLHFALLLASAFGILLGYLYRLSCLLFTLLFAHLFLIEQLVYNNHFYLYCLLGLLFLVTPADASFSLKRRPKTGAIPTPATIPSWALLLFRAQIVIVYFYGGIAKLNADWLAGEPLRKWLAVRGESALAGSFLTEEWVILALAWGGLVFDLAIGFLLCWRRTFLPAAALTVLFHSVNLYLFDIGAFPILGIATIILFAPPDLVRRALNRWQSRTDDSASLRQDPTPATSCGPLVFAAISAYLLLQAALPLRVHLYEGTPSWHESAHRFSWRMMLRSKDAAFGLILTPEAQALMERRSDLRLSEDQGRKMSRNPNLIHQYVQHLRREFEHGGLGVQPIHVTAITSLNGRPFQFLIDPGVDLAATRNPVLATPDWIVPLEPGQPIGEYHDSTRDRIREVQALLETIPKMDAGPNPPMDPGVETRVGGPGVVQR